VLNKTLRALMLHLKHQLYEKIVNLMSPSCSVFRNHGHWTKHTSFSWDINQ